MSLSAFVLFMLGALGELLLLAERALPPGQAYHSRLGGWRGLLDTAIFYTPMRLLALALAALAAVLVGLFELLGWGSLLVYIDTPLVSLLFTVLGVLLLFATLAAGYFLPAINTQNLLLAQGVMLAGALLDRGAIAWLPAAWLIWAPALVMALLLGWQVGPRLVSRSAPRAVLPPEIKALLYFWYLLCALLTTFQSGQTALFEADQLAWGDAFSLGTVLVFMLVHGMAAMRFFLISSSLLLPRNRAMAAHAMPRLFSDEPAPALRFVLVALGAAGFLLANRAFGWLAAPLALSLTFLAAVQLLNPGRRS